MRQREENRRGLQVGQDDTTILSSVSTINYLDQFPIIYRDRSQSLEDISKTYALVEHGRNHQHQWRCSNLLDLEIT